MLPIAQLDDFVRDPGESSGCVQDNGVFCFDWAADNIDRYWTPLLEHIVLVGVSVALGFVIALGLAVFAGGGGLGEEIYRDITFRTGVAITGMLTIGLAIILDLCIQLGQRRLMPWRLV